MDAGSTGAARSQAAVNFDKLAGAIEREAGTDRSTQTGAMEGRQVSIGLVGKDKPVKFEMMTNEMVQQFMKMTHEERQERIGNLQARLQEVKSNPNFSDKGQQTNAKIQLSITVPMLVKQLKNEAKVKDFHEAQASEAKMKEANMKAIQNGKAKVAENANSLGEVAKGLGEKYMDDFAKVNMGGGSHDEKIAKFQALSDRIQTQLDSPQVQMSPEGRKTLEQLKGVIGKSIENETHKKSMEGLGVVAKALCEKYNADFGKLKTGEGSPQEKIAQFQELSGRIQKQLDSGAPLGDKGKAALEQMKQKIGQEIDHQKTLIPPEPQVQSTASGGILSGKPNVLPLGESFHKNWNSAMDKIISSDKTPDQKKSALESRLQIMERDLATATSRKAISEGQKATLQGDIQRCKDEIGKLTSGKGETEGSEVEGEQAPEHGVQAQVQGPKTKAETQAEDEAHETEGADNASATTTPQQLDWSKGLKKDGTHLSDDFRKEVGTSEKSSAQMLSDAAKGLAAMGSKDKLITGMQKDYEKLGELSAKLADKFAAADNPTDEKGKLRSREERTQALMDVYKSDEFKEYCALTEKMVGNYGALTEKVGVILMKDAKVKAAVEDAIQTKITGLDLPALLIPMVQRLPRHALLLRDIQSKTPKELHGEIDAASKIAGNAANAVNSAVKEYEKSVDSRVDVIVAKNKKSLDKGIAALDLSTLTVANLAIEVREVVTSATTNWYGGSTVSGFEREKVMERLLGDLSVKAKQSMEGKVGELLGEQMARLTDEKTRKEFIGTMNIKEDLGSIRKMVVDEINDQATVKLTPLERSILEKVVEADLKQMNF